MSNDTKEHECYALLMDNIGFLLGKSCSIKDRFIDHALASADLIEEITATQAKVLFQIDNLHNYRPSDIGKMLNVDKSSITRMVDRLLLKDLITRFPDPEDRRSCLLGLTEKGQQLIEQSKPIVHGALDDLEHVLTAEEQQQMRHCLQKIVASALGDDGMNTLVRGKK
ncbi:MarR family winged helix-turn-helix transcriptional regulator [Vibrio palustris]|uniref:Multiple antibiotic resistance protein MarR n=1 Tax=Vibrio palustris TaxID=1918946 RepID=A0A1R4B5J9_9VIBR|nr:MarR family transcriptional regulator [Vibrio palustris]SJL84190.1 Multiple antibiotic resistance protein MarR [Vibrio palustris]